MEDDGSWPRVREVVCWLNVGLWTGCMLVVCGRLCFFPPCELDVSPFVLSYVCVELYVWVKVGRIQEEVLEGW